MKYRYQYENEDATNHNLKIVSEEGEFVSGLDLAQAAKICSKLNELSSRLVETEVGNARYEKVRKLNPQQFTDLYSYNIFSAIPFDKIIDDFDGYK